MGQHHDLGASDTRLAPQVATNVRWRVLGLLMALAFMGHFNRVGMSVAGTERLMDEFEISKTQMGWVYSAYLLVYTILMTPGGWLIDRAGPRAALVGMGFGAAVLGAATCLPGLVTLPAVLIFPAFLLIRSLVGAANVPLHPGAARTISLWMPPAAQAQGNGLVSFAAVVGIALCYPGFGWLIERFGWPAAFVIGGAALGVVAALFAALVTDRPGQHPRVNHAEWQLNEGAGAAESLDARDASAVSAMSLPSPETPLTVGERPSWAAVLSLLGNRSLILLTISFAAVGYVQYLFFYWLEQYFIEEVHLSDRESRKYTMIVTLAMAVGMALGGVLSDWFERKGQAKYPRGLVPVTGLLVSGAFVLVGVSNKELTWIVTSFALALAAVGLCEGAFWKLAVELGGSRGGSAAAIINTGGNAGGLVAPILTPWLAGFIGWQNSVGLASAVCLVGAILWYWIDPKERVD